MKIIKKGKMPDGTEIRLEDWNENYDFVPPSSTIAAYAKSKASFDGDYAPKAGEVYRFQFDFENAVETEITYNALLNGEKMLSDYTHKLYRKRYASCI